MDRAVKAEDTAEINIAKAELAFSHNKSYRTLVVRAWLEMSCEAMNLACKLLAEELRHDSQRQISSVTSPYEQRLTIN